MGVGSMRGFIIGAPHSGSGKTTLTLGLLHFLRYSLGYSVQPFKCGPDFVDPQFQSRVAGRGSVNLDLFLQGVEGVKRTFATYSQGCDVAVVEGVMGLFDGYNRDEGSAAHLARLLNLPVVLVVDARAMGYSAAALLQGYRDFNPSVRIAGVIFNRVSGESHYDFLRAAAERAGVESLGYLPRRSEAQFAERELGLAPGDAAHFLHTIESIASGVAEHVEVEKLLALTPITQEEVERFPLNDCGERGQGKGRRSAVRTAVARDGAFSFLYRENLDALARWGEVRYFSPVAGDAVPADCDFVYLPGGYPELYLELLTRGAFLRSLREWVESGGALVAEGGGMMVLSSEVEDAEGKCQAMAGVLPMRITFKNRRLQMGYRKVVLDGVEFRGHEFHYSRIDSCQVDALSAPCYNARQQAVNTPLFRVKNCFASYMHFLWGDVPPWEQFLPGVLSEGALRS